MSTGVDSTQKMSKNVLDSIFLFKFSVKTDVIDLNDISMNTQIYFEFDTYENSKTSIMTIRDTVE